MSNLFSIQNVINNFFLYEFVSVNAFSFADIVINFNWMFFVTRNLLAIVLIICLLLTNWNWFQFDEKLQSSYGIGNAHKTHSIFHWQHVWGPVNPFESAHALFYVIFLRINYGAIDFDSPRKKNKQQKTWKKKCKRIGRKNTREKAQRSQMTQFRLFHRPKWERSSLNGSF